MKEKLINGRIALIKKIKNLTLKYMEKKHSYYNKKRLNYFNKCIIFWNIINVKKIFKVPFKIKLKMYKNGFKSDDYFRYNFKENDMNDYISELERWKTREINGEYNIIFDDKRIFYEMYKNYFDIPHNIGEIENGKIYDEQSNIVKLEKILDKYNSIIIKPFIGGSGRSIHKIENRNKSFYLDEEKTNISKIKNIISNQEKSIITIFIDQHEYAKKLFPKTTNTIRIITIKDPETNKYIIPCAVQRIGNSKSIPVDNAGSGGYFALIDVDTGIIGEAKSYFETEIYYVHPDSKSPIKGVKIPNWNNIKESIIKVAEQFPYIHFTAWDVVITKNGFSIIEGNTSTDIYLFQCFKGYRNSKLGQFYKYHNIFKNK